jgi:hypothetical protein
VITQSWPRKIMANGKGGDAGGHYLDLETLTRSIPNSDEYNSSLPAVFLLSASAWNRGGDNQLYIQR